MNMIKIQQRQKKISFNAQLFAKKAELILAHLGYQDFDLGILLTTNATIRQYNKLYRNKDKATDVLSFPYHEELKAGKKIKVTCDEDKNLGDLIISLPYVYDNNHHLRGTFEQRMDRMLVHGICHLLGHDHIQDADYRKMIRLENQLLKIIQSAE